MSTATETRTTIHLSAPGASGRNCRLVIDGQDISRFSRSFALNTDVDSTTTATIGLLPTKGFDLELQAKVALNVTAFPGYVLIEETTGNVRRWRTEPEKRG
jgi:hypothetical protein